MGNIDLKLLLSNNRNQSGVLIVSDRSSGRVLGQYQALGRGSQGPGNTQMQVNGNTPTGTYTVTRAVSTQGWPQNSYGPNGALRLDPSGGNAHNAHVGGRNGFLIHGGSLGGPGYWRGPNELRATHGCIRLQNDDVRRLIQILFNATLDPGQNRSQNVDVTLSVTDHAMTFTRP